MNIIFVVNSPDFLISHRLQICEYIKKIGYQVHLICPKDDSSNYLLDLGYQLHFLSFPRNRFSPIAEVITFFKLIYLFKKISPDLVHLITIKPYLYGGIASRIVGIRAVVSAVAGLGTIFSSNHFKYSLLRILLFPFFKIAFGHKNQSVIFQNDQDRDRLVNWGVVAKEKVVMIRGSGVDIKTCLLQPEPNDIPVVSLAARLLRDKGVEVFVEASRILQKRGLKVRFWLIGEIDKGNANSVSEEEVRMWESEGLIETFGFREDIPYLFSKSNIVTLPSYYGEGLPKVLLEAAACGRAVVTTDHPGCRDAISAGETGLLVKVKIPTSLANAIQFLIDHPDIRKRFGRAGRALVKKNFLIEKNIMQHIKTYNELLE